MTPHSHDGGKPPVSIINVFDLLAHAQEQGVPVHGAPALGVPLHSNGHLGADLLFVKGGDEFPVHTHPGDHLLFCMAGEGTITVDRKVYAIRPGDLYMVDGMVPHAVGATTDHMIVAIGAPHKPVASKERMAFTDWDGNAVDRPLSAGDDSTPAEL